MRTRELLEECPRAGEIHSSSRCETQRPRRAAAGLTGRGVRDAATMRGSEPDVLLHGPVRLMARSGHVNKMARRGEVSGHVRYRSSYADALRERADPSAGCETATRPPSRRSSSASARGPANAASRGEATPVRARLANLPRRRRPPRPRRLRRRNRGGWSFPTTDTSRRSRSPSPTRIRTASGPSSPASSRPTLVPPALRSSSPRSVATIRECLLALLRRLGSLSLTWRGGERELVIGLER